MLIELFCVRIAAFAAAFGRYCRSSRCFCLAARVWHRLCRLCSESFFGRLLCRHDVEGARAEGSLIIGAVNGALRFVLRILGKLTDLLTFSRRSSLILDGARWFVSLYRFFDTEFFFGLLLCFVLLCPGSLWHNVYGLGIGALMLVLFIIYAAVEKRAFLPIDKLGLPFLLFAVSSGIGVCSAADKGDAMRIFTLFLTAFLFYIFIVADITDEKKLQKVLGAVWFCLCVTACVGFVQRVLGVEVSASLTDLNTNAGMPGRVFSTFENPNNYAEFLVLAIPLAFVFCKTIKNVTLRFLAYCSMLLPIAALLMTYSRSGWVSFALAAAVFVFLYNKRLIPAMLVLLIMAIPMLPQTVLNRMSTIGSTADSSNMYRVYIWQGVLDMIKKNWFAGVGLGPVNFRAEYLKYCVPAASPAPHSHMLFLEIWVETGLIGILSYFAMLFSSLRKGLLALKGATDTVRLAIIGCISSLVGIMFSCTAEYVWYYQRVMFFYFIVLGLLIAAVNMSGKRGERELL